MYWETQKESDAVHAVPVTGKLRTARPGRIHVDCIHPVVRIDGSSAKFNTRCTEFRPSSRFLANSCCGLLTHALYACSSWQPGNRAASLFSCKFTRFKPPISLASRVQFPRLNSSGWVRLQQAAVVAVCKMSPYVLDTQVCTRLTAQWCRQQKQVIGTPKRCKNGQCLCLSCQRCWPTPLQ